MSEAGVRAFIGLGSNLGQPVRQVREALTELGDLPQTRVIAHSALYGSKALGPPGQDDYVNAVAALQTTLGSQALLEALQAVEHRHGRIRGERWGPRTLDLDILLYGRERIDSPRLKIPHPQMHRRPFVLIPLHDLAPDLDLPGLGPLGSYMPGETDPGLWPLEQQHDA